jgi:flagellar hook-associated protein 2
MATTTTSLGIGTGVDLNAMLTKLMAAERQPIDALNTKVAATTTKLTTFGVLKSALATLQTAVETLSNPSKLAALSATSSDATKLTASTSVSASSGNYAINVTDLAAAQKSFSSAFATGTTFGQGSLEFSINGTTQSIALNDQASYSLQDIRSKINAANIGVTASVISGSGGDRLVFAGTTTGAAGAFSLTVAAGSTTAPATSLSGLAGFDETTSGLARSTAKDASLTIDGVAVSSASNTITDAVNGVTLNLLNTGSSTISIKGDTTAINEAVSAFVGAYNALNSVIKQNSTYDAATKTAKPLNGESSVRSIQSALHSSRTTVPAELAGAAYQTLSSLGISFKQDGSLSIDSTKLTNAISTSSGDVQKTLTAYGSAMKTTISGLLDAQGVIAGRMNGLSLSAKSNKDSIAALEIRVAAVQKRYTAQFTALDKLMSQMNTTSSYLTQQLSKSSS